MSQPATEQPVQGQEQPPVTDPPQEPQEPQSPYAEYLEELPETIRPLVEPAFKKWDGSVTQRFQELHSRYEPWKQVTEEYQPEDVLGALQVASVIEEDPERFLQAFVQAYPELAEKALQGQGGTQQPTTTTPPNSEQGLGDLDPEDPIAKKIQQLEETISQLTGTVTERQQQEQAQEAQQYLDGLLEQLHKDHGEFDDTFILSQLAFANRTPEQAIQAWKDLQSKYLSPQQQTQTPAPPVISTSGGVPSTVPDIGEMDSKETKNLVAQLLEQAAQADQ